MPIVQICSTPQCCKKVTARGFCVACYYKKLRHGEVQSGTQTKRWRHRLTNIDEINKKAICAHCGEVKITKRSKTNNWRCSVDVNLRSKDYKKAYRQVKKEQLIDHCEICLTKENLCWDHDHTTGKFRGTLCGHCNTAIGFFKNDSQLCINASIYLSKQVTND